MASEDIKNRLLEMSVQALKSDLNKYITNEIARQFRTFGGGGEHGGNPIAAAMQDSEPQFALGVNVSAVVASVLLLNKIIGDQYDFVDEDLFVDFKKGVCDERG